MKLVPLESHRTRARTIELSIVQSLDTRLHHSRFSGIPNRYCHWTKVRAESCVAAVVVPAPAATGTRQIDASPLVRVSTGERARVNSSNRSSKKTRISPFAKRGYCSLKVNLKRYLCQKPSSRDLSSPPRFYRMATLSEGSRPSGLSQRAPSFDRFVCVEIEHG